MSDSRNPRWLGAALLAGVLYLVIGVVSSALAGAAATPKTQFFWRFSAFVMSGLVFAAHLALEHFRLRRATWPAAWHTSMGVAFGGFAFALAANIHDLGSASGYRPRMLLALVAWPLVTAVPALVVALVAAALARRIAV